MMVFNGVGIDGQAMSSAEFRIANSAQSKVMRSGGTREEALAAGDNAVRAYRATNEAKMRDERRAELAAEASESARRGAIARGAAIERQREEEEAAVRAAQSDNTVWWIAGGVAAVLVVGGGIYWMRSKK